LSHRLRRIVTPFFFFSTPRDLALVAPFADLGMVTGVGDLAARLRVVDLVVALAGAFALAAALAIVTESDEVELSR
jgi:hypothetical protein